MAGLIASSIQKRRQTLPYLGQLAQRGLNAVVGAPPLYEEGSPIDTGVQAVRKLPNVGLTPADLIAGAGAGLAGIRGLASFLRSKPQPPEEPLGDFARGMGMTEPDPNASAGASGTDTTNPAVMGARNSPSPVDESPLFSDTEMSSMRERNAAAHYRPATRAIRLPGGKFVFTNRDELGGEEVGVRDAGREIRGADATPANVRMSEAPRLDPTSATMSALVRSSIRSSRGERAPGLAVSPQPVRGRMVPGETPDISSGSVSMIEGTPQQQLDIRLNDALGALSLAGVNQQRQVAEMDPASAALLNNPQVQAGSWALNALMPRIEQANKQAEQEAAQARTQIQDPKQLQQALREIEDRRRNTLIETQSILAVLLGIRPQTIT